MWRPWKSRTFDHIYSYYCLLIFVICYVDFCSIFLMTYFIVTFFSCKCNVLDSHLLNVLSSICIYETCGVCFYISFFFVIIWVFLLFSCALINMWEFFVFGIWLKMFNNFKSSFSFLVWYVCRLYLTYCYAIKTINIRIFNQPLLRTMDSTIYHTQ